MTGSLLLQLELRQACRRVGRLGGSPAARLLLLLPGLLLLAGCVVWLSTSQGKDFAEVLVACCIFGGGLLSLLTAPGVGATAICGDRQRGSWDLLVTSLLTQQELICGKLAGRLLWAGLPILLATVALAAGLLVELQRAALLQGQQGGVLAIAGATAAGLVGLPWLLWRLAGRWPGPTAAAVVGLLLLIVGNGLLASDLPRDVVRVVAAAYLSGPLTVLHLTVVGLWCSVAARRSGAALGLSYGYMVATQFVLPVLEAMVRRGEPLLGAVWSAPVALILYADQHDAPECLLAMGQPVMMLLLTSVLLAALLSPRRRRWVEGTLG
ncbi:MAG: hypothetical protein IT204_13395 [Fimbriimonadaceae bacterium]|nr:hypothetical protein [Fimbriimonadaceae bacterium]